MFSLGGYSYWKVSCHKKLNHYIDAITKVDDDSELYYLEIMTDSAPTYAHWDFKYGVLYIKYHGTKYSEMELPFFEPDLSNYDRLIEKMRLYTILA